jgi:integrase
VPAPKNRVHLTDRLLRTLCGDGVRRQLMDEDVRNFGLRVNPSGSIVFFVRYRIGRHSRRQNLGTYPNVSLAAARAEAREVVHRAGHGEDPQRERLEARRAATFGDLAGDYLERYARREKRRWKEDERILEKDLLPAWRNLPAGDIDAGDVHRVLDAIVDREARIMANRTRSLISRIFNFGIERRVVAHNPVAGVRPPARERSRQVVLSEDQLKALWAVWTADATLTAAAFQLFLVTAQRETEVLTMRWQDVDGEWWCIPPEVVKNKLAHRVYLSPLAMAIVGRLRLSAGDSPWVFASPKKKGERPIVAVNKAAERFCSKSGVGGWTPHDLRRTAATCMSRLGVPRIVIGKILNHADAGVTAIYDRSDYEPEIKDALSRWGGELQRVLGLDLSSLASVALRLPPPPPVRTRKEPRRVGRASGAQRGAAG